MAYDFCKVTIIGRLVADPRRGDGNGKTVLNCRIAARVGFGNNESTTFLDFALWDKLADAMAPKLSKGDKVAVHGDLGQREYEKNGVKHTTYEVRFTDSFLLLEDTRGREDTGERSRGDGRDFGGREDFNPPRGGGFPGRR